MRPIFSFLLSLLLFLGVLHAQTSPVRPLLIQQGNDAWLGAHDGLYRWQAEAELMTRVEGAPVRDLLLDENTLWAATGTGLRSADLKYLNWKSWGKEQGLAADSVNRVAADLDFVYAATAKGLFRMDKLVEQWEPLGNFFSPVFDLYSDQDNLWTASAQGVRRYLKAYDRWEDFNSQSGLLSDTALRVFEFRNRVWVLHPAGFSEYNPAMRSWRTHGSETGFPQGAVRFFQTEGAWLWTVMDSSVYRFGGDNEAWERFSLNTPVDGQLFRGFSVSGSQAWFLTGNTVHAYEENGRRWTAYTPADGLPGNNLDRLWAIGKSAICGRDGVFAIFRPADGQWFTRKTLESRGGSAAFTPYSDSRGAGVELPDGRSVNLLGRAYFKLRNRADIPGPLSENIPDYLFKARGDELEKYDHFLYWWEKADLNLNAGLGNERNLLGSFDNTDPSGDVRYNALFRGNSDDRLRSLGLQENAQADYFYSTLLDPTRYEGAAARLQFGERVGERKRSRLNTAAFAGGLKTRYVTRRLRFREDNSYELLERNILSESVELRVDGERLDPSEYSLERTLGILTFRDESRVTPASIIDITFESEPSLLSHTGRMAAAEQMVTVSDHLAVAGTGIVRERDGLSADGRGRAANRLYAGNLSAEIEYRAKDGGGLFRAVPEISGSYEDSVLFAKQGQAGRLRLNAVRGPLRFRGSGRALTDNYESVAELSSVYGRVHSEGEGEAVWDILSVLPVTGTASALSAGRGGEARYGLSGVLSPGGLPSLKLAVNRWEGRLEDADSRDSITHNALGGRVETEWEAPGAALNSLRLSRLYTNLSYDLDHDDGDSLDRGFILDRHTLFGRLRLSPHPKWILETRDIYRIARLREGGAESGRILGRSLRPEFILYSQEGVPGLSLYGRLRVDRYQDYPDPDTLARSRDYRFNGSLLITPGSWFKSMNPFQLNTAYSERFSDSLISENADDTLLRQGRGTALTLSPALYLGQDVRYYGRVELTGQSIPGSDGRGRFLFMDLDRSFLSARSGGLKLTNDLDLFLRMRRTNLLFEYDYSADSARNPLSGFVRTTAHQVRGKWAERWFPMFRTEFKTGVGHTECDTLAGRPGDSWQANLLLDWRTEKWVREFRVQERFGPSFSNGRGFDLNGYDAAFENRLDLSLKMGRNFYARLLLNLVYRFETRILEYETSEFKLTAVF